MPTAAISDAPTASADVEAALPTSDDRGEGEDVPAPVEVEAEQEQEDAERSTPAWMCLHGRRQMADFPFFALGFAAVVSLVFIISDLMNEHTFHPITAGVFLLSSSYCIAIIRREWSGAAGAEGAGASRRPGVLTKEARESLLTYFVFEGPAVEGAAAAESAGGKADQPQPQEQEQERAEGKDLPSTASTGVIEEMNSSGGGGGTEWRREDGSRKSGQESGGLGLDSSGSGSCGSGMRDERASTDATNADTDSLPNSTPAASPGPSSPVPLVPSERQPHLEGGDGGGGGDDAEDQGEARRIRGSAPFDGRGLDLAVEATSAATSATTTALGAHAEKTAPETPETPETTAEPEEHGQEGADEADAAAAATAATADAAAAASPTPAAGGVKDGAGSGSGEWSTDHSCIVCFGDYCPGDLLCRLPCRHVYHAKCIDEWLDRARLPCCPLCKTDLRASGTDGDGDGTAASGRGGGSIGAATASSGANVADVMLTGDNAV